MTAEPRASCTSEWSEPANPSRWRRRQEHYLDGPRNGSRGAIRARKGAWRWPERPEQRGGNLPLTNAGRWQRHARRRVQTDGWRNGGGEGEPEIQRNKVPVNSFAQGRRVRPRPADDLCRMDRRLRGPGGAECVARSLETERRLKQDHLIE